MFEYVKNNYRDKDSSQQYGLGTFRFFYYFFFVYYTLNTGHVLTQ